LPLATIKKIPLNQIRADFEFTNFDLPFLRIVVLEMDMLFRLHPMRENRNGESKFADITIRVISESRTNLSDPPKPESRWILPLLLPRLAQSQ
jgi:hypothetical protein